MPNNQDVKLLPFKLRPKDVGRKVLLRNGNIVKITKFDKTRSQYPYHIGGTTLAGCGLYRYGTQTPYDAVAFAEDNTRAPTPREQELEAQNKALWELVDTCQIGLQGCVPLLKDAFFFGQAEGIERLIAAIQKAKEAKV